MGRTYLFECSRCEFRAKVSGRADKGFALQVQTILCRDCKNLYDAVTRLKTAELPPTKTRKGAAEIRGSNLLKTQPRPESAPTFQAALNRLAFPGARKHRWVEFRMRCPVSPSHRVRIWNEPDSCPKCGIPLEKHPLPFRIWD
jgi:hypothetical protein